MNLSQLRENLQCAEMVIQFYQGKTNLIGKIKSCRACEHPCHLKKKVMPGYAVTPNAGPGLILNCLVKVQNSYKTPHLPMVRMNF